MSGRRIAFIGIGRMGWHMAGHLVKAGHEVVVCDAVPGQAAKWATEFGGRAADDAASAVSGCDVVITSLPADRELREVADAVVPVFSVAAIAVLTSVATSFLTSSDKATWASTISCSTLSVLSSTTLAVLIRVVAEAPAVILSSLTSISLTS